MRVLLLQLDGKVPNIALMRIAAHHRERGDEVELRWQSKPRLLLWDRPFDHVYASVIFAWNRERGEHVLREWPHAIIGGTGWDMSTTLEGVGIATKHQDYSDYPAWRQSIGFTQRGCRLSCWFCVVPLKEGRVRTEQSISDLWRGEPWPRELILLDNDFFGQSKWQQLIEEIRAGGFKVSFNQGINARMLNDESAAAIASIRYYDDGMTARRIYTAWDSTGDERVLFRGLEALVRHGVKPDHIMVYMLIDTGKDNDSEADWLYRHDRLLEFGARPYPMAFNRTRIGRDFQRWAIRRCDRFVSWEKFKAAGGRPERLTPIGAGA